MPRPAIKRRKAVEAVPSSNAITNFTRVAKSRTCPDASTKKSALLAEQPASLKRKADSPEQSTHARRRRRRISFPPSSDEEGEEEEEEGRRDRATTKRPRRAGPSSIAFTAPSVKAASKGGKRVARPTPARTKTTHRPSQSTIIASSVQQQKAARAKIDALRRKKADIAAAKTGVEDTTLPPHLAELVTLNKAFLKTVTIYIAHHGWSSPIDIRAIAPNISRAWGKRQVTVSDILRCIGIQSLNQAHSPSPFIVSDYGRGRVCIEMAAGVDGGCVNEKRLRRQFEDNIQALCADKAMDQMADVDVSLDSLSLSDLPQAAIMDRGDALQTNPLVAKGQRALSALKTELAAKQQEREQKHQASSQANLVNPDGSKMSLLDRIRYKQLVKANEPLPASGPELQRRAALNRVTDVSATISMLSLSNSASLPRQAFTMMVISEKLRDSLRVPLSEEESMACVRLIATEVAPEWLRIVTIGGRENVVIQRLGQPIDRVIQERVQKLLAA